MKVTKQTVEQFCAQDLADLVDGSFKVAEFIGEHEGWLELSSELSDAIDHGNRYSMEVAKFAHFTMRDAGALENATKDKAVLPLEYFFDEEHASGMRNSAKALMNMQTITRCFWHAYRDMFVKPFQTLLPTILPEETSRDH